MHTQLEQYKRYLMENEKAKATIEKYERDIKKFLSEIKEVTKEEVINWKSSLEEKYKVSSRNSMIVSINQYLEYIGKPECKVKHFREQRVNYVEEEKDLSKKEYDQILQKIGYQKRIRYIIQTIGSTGIRISELKYITVESLTTGRAEVKNKGKERVILLPKKLCKKLLKYCRRRKIETGMVFVTRSGKAVDRSNIWREMKQAEAKTEIKKEKLYPHNLRHLFAKTYYKLKHDIVSLADILGHSNINTTRIYTRTTQAEQAKTLEKMNLV